MRRFAPAAPAAEPMPMLNVTPLIDVLLVLLVMLILTIPIVANQIPIDLPASTGVPPHDRMMHRLSLTREGATMLDGAVIAPSALPARLATLRDDPRTALVVHADPEARYEAFAQTLAVVKRAGITRLGFDRTVPAGW